MRNQAFVLLCVVVLGVVGTCHGGGLKKNYYASKCRNAEQIIKNATEKRVAIDPTLPAKFIRMHFHDCFVRGCDASVLVNSTANNTAEKDAVPNQTLGGFSVIDDIKAEVEKKCPNVVSCADVLALAARDAVSFKFNRPLWEVLTGRRDGRVSRRSEALANIPSPFSNFTTLVKNFANHSLNVRDLVVLSGAHTIGVSHCSGFFNRLYNFTGKGDQDPSLNATYAAFLKTQCKTSTDNTTITPMDPITPLTFDTNYYVVLKQKRGLFESDAALLTNGGSSNLVNQLLNQNKFFAEFAKSIKKMGAIGVLTGNAGEIRKKCFAIN
ncbi:hypothetical protein V6N13_093726 [Hibiscus sabdariffa]|uniref:Peroxidase n=1 Tax=Hibiscus sabdariffa TaxID=183260 RepID=A0ABR2BRV4_9ROSI